MYSSAGKVKQRVVTVLGDVQSGCGLNDLSGVRCEVDWMDPHVCTRFPGIDQCSAVHKCALSLQPSVRLSVPFECRRGKSCGQISRRSVHCQLPHDVPCVDEDPALLPAVAGRLQRTNCVGGEFCTGCRFKNMLRSKSSQCGTLTVIHFYGVSIERKALTLSGPCIGATHVNGSSDGGTCRCRLAASFTLCASF